MCVRACRSHRGKLVMCLCEKPRMEQFMPVYYIYDINFFIKIRLMRILEIGRNMWK